MNTSNEDEDKETIDEILSVIRPTKLLDGGFNEIDSYVLSLINEFKSLSDEIAVSSESSKSTLHSELALDACRLARRIRLRLGNPRNLPGEVKDRVINLFREAAANISCESSLDSQIVSDVKQAKSNIEIRACRLEHPDELEEQFLSSSISSPSR